MTERPNCTTQMQEVSSLRPSNAAHDNYFQFLSFEWQFSSALPSFVTRAANFHLSPAEATIRV